MWSDKLCGQITYNLRQLGSQGAQSFARGVGRLGRKGKVKGPAAASGEGAAAGPSQAGHPIGYSLLQPGTELRVWGSIAPGLFLFPHPQPFNSLEPRLLPLRGLPHLPVNRLFLFMTVKGESCLTSFQLSPLPTAPLQGNGVGDGSPHRLVCDAQTWAGAGPCSSHVPQYLPVTMWPGAGL